MTTNNIRQNLLAALTSVALFKVIEEIKSSQAINATEVETLGAQRARYLVSGNTVGVQHTLDRIAAATLNGECLQAMLDDARARVIALQAAESQATEALKVAQTDANKKTAVSLTLSREKYDEMAALAVAIFQLEREALESRRHFYQLHGRSPALARAAVSASLIEYNLFAPGHGAATLAECITILPPLASPDAPDLRAPRWWPPLPPVLSTPATPPAPAREPLPYVKRGLTVEFTVPRIPGPFEPDEDDLMALRAPPAAP